MAKVAKMEDERTGTGYDTKECPRCNKEKDVDTDFGYRLSKGKIIKQSWCRQCRGLSSILGPAKAWAHQDAKTIMEKAEAKRAFMRKPKKEKKTKQQEKQSAIATAVIQNNPRTGFQAVKKEAKDKGLTVRQVLGEDPILKQAPKNVPPAPTKKVTPDPVADDKVVWLSADLGSTKVLFAKHFPDDKQLRSWKTMIQRLLKKLGDRAQLTKTAKERLGHE